MQPEESGPLYWGCSGQGKSMLNVCRRHDWALNEYPGATFHKDQNILEVKWVAIFLWSSLHSSYPDLPPV